MMKNMGKSNSGSAASHPQGNTADSKDRVTKRQPAKLVKFIPDYFGGTTDWQFGQEVSFLRTTTGKISGYTYEGGKYGQKGLVLIIADDEGSMWSATAIDVTKSSNKGKL